MTRHQAIGGYFELELRQGQEFHATAIALNSARNCLEYILRTRHYKKVYIPYYTCEVILEPFRKLGVGYEFYSINSQLEPTQYPTLKSEEAFLYTNYFGLKQKAVERIAERYGKQAIIDNAQAFYAPPLPGIDTFYSPRKFFGVADGGYLYTDAPPLPDIPLDSSWQRMQHLLRRIDEGAEAGYSDFRTNSKSLVNAPIRGMSLLTRAILASIDYDSAKNKRLENYEIFAKALQHKNAIHISPDNEDVPLIYPFYAETQNLRHQLILHRIFVATYWPNVFTWCGSTDYEYQLAQNTLPLPIDQRYSPEHLQFIIDTITAS